MFIVETEQPIRSQEISKCWHLINLILFRIKQGYPREKIKQKIKSFHRPQRFRYRDLAIVIPIQELSAQDEFCSNPHVGY